MGPRGWIEFSLAVAFVAAVLISGFLLQASAAEPEDVGPDLRRAAIVEGFRALADRFAREAGFTQQLEAIADNSTAADRRAFLAQRSPEVRSSTIAALSAVYFVDDTYIAREALDNLVTWHECQTTVRLHDGSTGSQRFARLLSLLRSADAVERLRACYRGRVDKSAEAVACQGLPCPPISHKEIMWRARIALGIAAERFRATASEIARSDTAYEAFRVNMQDYDIGEDIVAAVIVADRVAGDALEHPRDEAADSGDDDEGRRIDTTLLRKFLRGRITEQIIPADSESTFYPGGGRKASFPDMPSVAMLLLNGEPECTATLVAPDVLLTAAHCICAEFGAQDCRKPDNPRTTASSWQAYFQHEAIVPVAATDWFAVPDDYRHYPQGDLAVVKLAKRITWIKHASLNAGAQAKAGEKVMSVGFGVHHSIAVVGGIPSDAAPGQGLRGVKLHGPALLLPSCPAALPTMPWSDVLCSQYRGSAAALIETGLCGADSGGPIFLGGSYALTGVASSNAHLQGDDFLCAKNQYSVFVDVTVAKKREWIDGEIKRLKSACPECDGREQLNSVLNEATDRYIRSQFHTLSKLALNPSFKIKSTREAPVVEAIVGMSASKRVSFQMTDPKGRPVPCQSSRAISQKAYAHICVLRPPFEAEAYTFTIAPKSNFVDGQIVVTTHHNRQR